MRSGEKGSTDAPAYRHPIEKSDPSKASTLGGHSRQDAASILKNEESGEDHGQSLRFARLDERGMPRFKTRHANIAAMRFGDRILDASALELARRIRARELDAEEVIERYLARIDERDPRVSAWVQVDREGALREARRKDRERDSGKPLPPFHGVPIGIKDLNLVKGLFARFGSRAFERLIGLADDENVKLLRLGGFVILGKTSTSELGALPITEPDIHPPTRNPWNLDHTSGGSSGGAGAAVAAGMIPIAQGSDGAGSIRIPASFSGLVGHKPSRGRVANSFGLADRDIIYTSGPIGRTVGDVAAMLDVMSGISVGAPHWAPPPPKSFALLAEEPLKKPLRVRVLTRTHLASTHPEIEAATLRVAKAFEDEGHHVEEATPLEGSVEEFLPIWQLSTAAAPVHDWDLVQPVTRWLALAGRNVDPARVLAVQREMDARISAWFAGCDLLVTPTVPGEAPRIGSLRGLAPAEAFASAAQLGPFTAPFNVTGQPAASVPVGFTANGLPIGVQLVGAKNDDGLVLQACRFVEERLPFRDRQAP